MRCHERLLGEGMACLGPWQVGVSEERPVGYASEPGNPLCRRPHPCPRSPEGTAGGKAGAEAEAGLQGEGGLQGAESPTPPPPGLV